MGIRRSITGKTSKQESVSQACATRVMETVPLMMRFIRADMRAQNVPLMSVPQFRSLAFLDRNPGASLSDLAEHLGVTRPTASSTLERLVQAEFVQRQDCPEERRRVCLNLTKAGKERLETSRAITRSHIAEYLEDLTEEQILQIEEGLLLLKNVFEQTEISSRPI